MSDPREDSAQGMPEEQWLAAMATIVMGQHNGTLDFSAPTLRPIVSRVFPLFVLQYGLLVLVGAAANVIVASHVLRQKLYRDVTHALLLNLLLSHCVQCLVVLPMTLTVLLVQNWVLGRFLCFFLPMLQDIPMHVCMLTHLLVAWDRLRWLSDPLKCRLPAFVCSCGTWLAGIVITLPYPIYINYMDLGVYLPQFQGVDFCTVNLVDDMHEYMRGLFLTLYCAPTILLCYLYVHTARELRPPEGPLGVLMFEARADARKRQSGGLQGVKAKEQSSPGAAPRRSYDLFDAEGDLRRERKTQQFLCSMAAVHVICISPLMVLRLARLVLEETYDNSGHLDLTYLLFVWVAYLPTVLSPWLYATWLPCGRSLDGLHAHLRLPSPRRPSTSSSSPPRDAEQARGQPQCHRKRASESSELTTVSSVRSASRQTSARTPSKGSAGSRAATQFEFPAPVSADGGPRGRSPRPALGDFSVQSSTSNLAETSSNLERDLEIIDLLERERSMDIQQGLERERQGVGARRQLPRISGKGNPLRNLVTETVNGQLTASSAAEYSMTASVRSSSPLNRFTRP